MNARKFKTHLKNNKKAYVAAGSGVLVAGFTCLIVRDVQLSQQIKRGTSVLTQRGTSVLGDTVTSANKQNALIGVMNNVSYFSSNRQGPPSWVIRCLETNEVFTSQAKAASELSIPTQELSKHLNGVMDNVRGLHFERLCMAA